MIGFNFGELFDNGRVVRRKTSKLGEGFGGLLVLLLLDEESWSLWQEEQPNADDNGPQELKSNRDSV
jgi:hypothetical protein